jgi:hypothetical protein
MKGNKMEIVKKLSVGKIVGKVTTLLPDSRTDVTPVQLGRVVGIAHGVKVGESTFGPWKALTGDFVFEPSAGANAGKRYRSGVLFVPDVILDLVAPAVENLAKGAAVELAFAVTAKNDPTTSVGYSYGCSFLQEPAANDPITALLDKAMPALPAPDADGKKGK